MKYFYIAVQVIENGKMYAYYIRENSSRNLWHDLSRIPGICSANIMPTKKAAAATVEAWNAGFKESGIYMFDDGPLF